MHALVVFVGIVFLLQGVPPKDTRGQGDRHVDPQYERKLKEQVRRNPEDVEALIELGLYYDDLQLYQQALPFFERAAELRPDERAYYFAALTAERVGWLMGEKAEGYARKALELNPDLVRDPNMQAFLRRHSRLTLEGGPAEAPGGETPRALWLTPTNLFFVGIGVGLLLAAPLLYVATRKRRF